MTLIPLPAFSDNYIWMVHDGQDALVVDPGDAQPVLDALQRENVQLKAILVTHHHHDHTGGVDRLRDATGATVYGPANEQIPQPLVRLNHRDTVRAVGLEFQVVDVPGHTKGHIAFYCPDMDEVPLLFCGDTLFSCGCGRLFEGTAAQMQHSLEQLAALPLTTRVCCTHEYTLSNLRFAREIEPGNAQLAAYQTHCLALRAAGKPTLPSTIAQERAINPFLRSGEPAVMACVGVYDALAVRQNGVFATLREWKNHYR